MTEWVQHSVVLGVLAAATVAIFILF